MVHVEREQGVYETAQFLRLIDPNWEQRERGRVEFIRQGGLKPVFGDEDYARIIRGMTWCMKMS